MSLTNPKNVVTEERLSEFYGEILPYLGGMPEALANKFSKGDLYSTDEKIIGCWTDGKPLYQKCVAIECPTVTTDGQSVDNTYTVASNIERVIGIEGYVSNTDAAGSSFIFLPSRPYGITAEHDGLRTLIAFFNHNLLYIQSTTNAYNGRTGYAIVKYTKTTDAANSFNYGSETDYSTTEKIVGTWIDGKPIYQKTIDYNTFPNNGIETSLSLGILIDTVVDYNLFYTNPQKQSCQKLGTLSCANADSSKFIKALVFNNRRSDQYKNSIYMINHIGDTSWDGGFIYGTIQYTKTTN